MMKLLLFFLVLWAAFTACVSHTKDEDDKGNKIGWEIGKGHIEGKGKGHDGGNGQGKGKATPTPLPDCPDGWLPGSNVERGVEVLFCAKYFDTLLNFQDALAACAQEVADSDAPQFDSLVGHIPEAREIWQQNEIMRILDLLQPSDADIFLALCSEGRCSFRWEHSGLEVAVTFNNYTVPEVGRTSSFAEDGKCTILKRLSDHPITGRGGWVVEDCAALHPYLCLVPLANNLVGGKRAVPMRYWP